MSPSDLREMQKKIHQTAKEKGWWQGWPDPEKRIPEAIALIHSELSEALEEYRKGMPPALAYHLDDPGSDSPAAVRITYADARAGRKPEGFGVELADAIIRILDLAEALGIDMTSLVITKMRFNETRPHRHGGKRA